MTLKDLLNDLKYFDKHPEWFDTNIIIKGKGGSCPLLSITTKIESNGQKTILLDIPDNYILIKNPL